MIKNNKGPVHEIGGGCCEFISPTNKHRKINPITTSNNNLSISSSQQEVVIVHLDYHPFGSKLLTNFYRTISKFKIHSTIIVKDNIAISNDIMSHCNSSKSILPQLLYRGTRDGFKAIDFHSRCDNQGPTLTVIKSEHNHIFGGFTKKSWISALFGTWVSDSSAFIFKIETNSNNTDGNNGNVNHHHQLFRKFNIKKDKKATAVWAHAWCLPIFGGGHDFRIYHDCHLKTNSYSHFGCSYELPTTTTAGNDDELYYNSKGASSYLAGSSTFQVSEIEVFKITIQQ